MSIDKEDKMLIEAVDEALSILGNNVKMMVYCFLEIKCGLKKEDILSNLKGFRDELHFLE